MRSIGYLNGKPYCRRCISFRGNEAIGDYPLCDKAEYHQEYELIKTNKDYQTNSLIFFVMD